ncbi:MAG: acylphosphatase [Bacteriovoracaceae bacterium]|jgi:acylphosphatase|nr:acylphosphatase [Bacteriovoracaceae bacterium]
MRKIQVFISGRVQGVGYRRSVLSYVHLNIPNLRGLVRNLADGRVEVLACGEIEDVDTLLTFLPKGPEFSRVSDVQIIEDAVIDESCLQDEFAIDH